MSKIAKNILSLHSGYDPSNKSEIEDVFLLQKILSNIGYPTSIDGRFGELTEASVKKFQKSKGLLDDGIVGKKTWNSLGINLEDSKVASFVKSVNMNLVSSKEYEESKKYKDLVYNFSSTYKIDPMIVFGIGSRESAWGLALKPPGPSGTGDFIERRTTNKYTSGSLPPDGKGFGRGLMQIDYDAHEFARTGKWDEAPQNIKYWCEVLYNNIKYFENSSNLSLANPDFKIRCAIASYNCGAGRVKQAILSGLDVDYFTAHRNYSKDVLERAAVFRTLIEK